jgi:hypothetical protein
MSKECIADLLSFNLRIDRIPSFVIGHSILDIHYSPFGFIGLLLSGDDITINCYPLKSLKLLLKRGQGGF